MSVMLVLIGFSLTVATGFLIAFLWAVKSGQYDDKYTPSLRILFDDPSPAESGRVASGKNIKLDTDENQPQKTEKPK